MADPQIQEELISATTLSRKFLSKWRLDDSSAVRAIAKNKPLNALNAGLASAGRAAGMPLLHRLRAGAAHVALQHS